MYQITFLKDGKAQVYQFRWPTREEALTMGQELVQSGAADFFRADLLIDRDKTSKKAEEVSKPYNSRPYRCGYCDFEGLVPETTDFTRCPNCGAC